jgi:hypothetical protein
VRKVRKLSKGWSSNLSTFMGSSIYLIVMRALQKTQPMSVGRAKGTRESPRMLALKFLTFCAWHPGY